MARQFEYTLDAPIVETKAGKLRGFVLDGIYTFHGIKYADAKRFQAPTPVEPWEGVKNATNYGYICPSSGSPAPAGELYIPHRFWPENENCQYLNVWTQGLDDGKKRPVMVWFHGGGYTNGSSIEQVAYEGDKLAAYGDVVVVTVNHRLNILGYFDMSAFGEKYKNSVNAGIEDLVVALQWVHDNIANFGGDPENVTIFGQSGGGSKVQAMMQTPAAAGLFHKGIIMSGVLAANTKVEKIDFKALALGMMRELRIPEDKPEMLEEVPYYFLDRAYIKVSEEMGIRVNWSPIANDWYKGLPLETDICEHAKTIPTMIGSTVGEMTRKVNLEDNQLTAEEVEAKVRAKFGEHADAVIAAFHKAFPESDLVMLDAYDFMFRPAAVDLAAKKASVSSAPTYLYSLALEFPIMGGVYAWHCADIPFVFHNIERVPSYCSEDVGERLQEEMAGAWVSFAYYGNPNHNNLVKWEPYGEKRNTMVFDRKCRCVEDLDTELVAEVEKAIGKQVFSMPNHKPDKSGVKKREWLY